MDTITRTTHASTLETLIEVRDYGTTASYAITPDQGLNITGRYTDKNKTGITFIVLGSEPAGQEFRQVLREARSKATK